MKNVLKWVAIVIGSLLAIAIIGGFVIPKEWSVNEGITINAPSEVVYAQIADLKNWQNWSPWTKEKDPTQEYTYEGVEPGVGQKWSWTSEKMGTGWLEIKTADPSKGITYELFMDMNGNQSTILGELTYVQTENGLDVVWKDSGNSGNNLIKRWMSLFIKPMLSNEMKAGLAKLKTVAEPTNSAAEKINDAAEPTNSAAEKINDAAEPTNNAAEQK